MSDVSRWVGVGTINSKLVKGQKCLNTCCGARDRAMHCMDPRVRPEGDGVWGECLS